MIMLAVNDHCKSILSTTMNFFPNVQNAAASRVDEDALFSSQMIHLADRHTKGRENQDISGLDLRKTCQCVRRLAENHNAFRPEPRINIRVMNNFAAQEDSMIRKLLPCLICVRDRSVDAVTKAKLAGKFHTDVTRVGVVSKLFEPLHG